MEMKDRGTDCIADSQFLSQGIRVEKGANHWTADLVGKCIWLQASTLFVFSDRTQHEGAGGLNAFQISDAL